MIRKENIAAFESQIFRQIGYAVGLWNLLQFETVCRPLYEKGSLDEEVLVRKVRESLVARRIDSSDDPVDEDEIDRASRRWSDQPKTSIKGRKPLSSSARGKIDVAKALGLIQSPPNLRRYALTAHGRALLAVNDLSDRSSMAVPAFYLWRVLESDADQFLTLFTILAKEQQDKSLEVELPRQLDVLLQLKYSACLNSSLPSPIKRRVDAILRIRDRKSGPKPFPSASRIIGRRQQTSESRFEVQGSAIPNYVRHTTGPRKRWLLDLQLLSQSSNGLFSCTIYGKRLLDFLKSKRCYQDGVPIIQPEAHVLVDLIGNEILFDSAPISFSFFVEMLSSIFYGERPRQAKLSPEQFLAQTRQVYDLVKLDRFEQAETAAIRECLAIRHAVIGETIDFDELLATSVQAFPESIALLSSTRARGTYVTLKGNGR